MMRLLNNEIPLLRKRVIALDFLLQDIMKQRVNDITEKNRLKMDETLLYNS